MRKSPKGHVLPEAPLDPAFVRAEAGSKLIKKAEVLLQKSPTKPLESLSDEEALKLIEELTELETHLMKKFDQAKQADPFWYFLPTTGEILPEAKELLTDFLKPDDIPRHFWSQLDVFLCLSDIIGIFGGNRSGKSTTGAVETFIGITGQVPFALESVYPNAKLPRPEHYPFKVRVVGEDWDNAIVGTLLPMYKELAPRDYLPKGEIDEAWSAAESSIKLVDPHSKSLKGFCEFMSNKQEVGSFQGPERHKIIYDEEPRQDIRQENMLRMATAGRFDELFCMTPTKGLTWVNQEIFEKSQLELADNRVARISVFEIATITNPKVNTQVLRKILEKIPNYNELLMRILGRFVSLKGKIYDGFDSKINVIEPFDIDKINFVCFWGIDPHLAKPSVAVVVACDRDENFYVVDCYRKGVNTQELKDDLTALRAPYRNAWSVCDKSADAAAKIFNDRNVYRELTTGKNFIPAVRKSEKYDGSIKAGINFIKELMQVNPITGKARLHIFNTPNNQRLIYSIKNLERAKGTNEDVTGEIDKILEGKHDEHACLRYIFQQPVHWIPPNSNLVPVYEPDNETIGY